MQHEQQVAVIQQVLTDIAPLIARDGGSIEFVRLEQDIVYVRLVGACVSCPSSIFTLKFGVQEALVQQLPHIKDVVAVE